MIISIQNLKHTLYTRLPISQIHACVIFLIFLSLSLTLLASH